MPWYRPGWLGEGRSNNIWGHDYTGNGPWQVERTRRIGGHSRVPRGIKVGPTYDRNGWNTGIEDWMGRAEAAIAPGYGYHYRLPPGRS